MDEEQTKIDSYWQQMRQFSSSRTNFWISLLSELCLTIIPFIALWLVVGPDFRAYSFNVYISKLHSNFGILIAIIIGYFVYALLFNTILFFVRLQKADSFTYTCGLAIVGASIILNGAWMINWEVAKQTEMLKIFIRFLLAVVLGIIGVIFGVLLTNLARNWAYKIEEEDREILSAYRQGLPVPSKHHLRVVRAEKLAQKHEADRQELELFKEQLNTRLLESYEDKKANEKAAIIRAKLDKKESKKRKQKIS
ncbi:hypothetical protein CXP39_01765 [Mesoplasma syrphidae]|uniref:Uncharacterized protein n=1 Tax=Mesoplasma syrphidae TaxID=225999 RepID=A0A2K9C5F4_9MOLU|nr:hypothetical protein [Mesoplasma syrphidae]AUF83517.1 hypothetical protein CXP39_01765 [Mesoplasma syrphidae]